MRDKATITLNRIARIRHSLSHYLSVHRLGSALLKTIILACAVIRRAGTVDHYGIVRIGISYDLSVYFVDD